LGISKSWLSKLCAATEGRNEPTLHAIKLELTYSQQLFSMLS
jgi:hypothetical protein